MRKELLPLFGKEVVCVGHYASSKHCEKNTSRTFFQNTKIYPCSVHRQLKIDSPSVKSDHLWVLMDNDKASFNDQIYKQNAIIGVGSEYRRLDQSVVYQFNPS